VFLFLIVEISVDPLSVLKTCISNQSLIMCVLFKGAPLNEPDQSDPFTARFDIIFPSTSFGSLVPLPFTFLSKNL
jgi:hypothetical protein